jgi:FkbM family methyltransferase
MGVYRMKLKYIKELKNIGKLSNFIDNPYLALLQYVERKEFINLKINNQNIKVSKKLFEQLIYSILNNMILSIELSGDQMIINKKEIRIFSCNRKYFDDNLILALNLSKETKKLGWKVEDGLWTNGKVRFLVMLGILMETFNYNMYYIEGIKGRDVVDIGGSIGDTAIFYKINGARNVISLELLSLPYNLAKMHIRINSITGVNFIRGALVPEKQNVNVPRCYPLYGSGGFSIQNDSFNDNEEVPTYTLSDIMPEDPYILKMDCEGCEYDIILKDYDLVRKFDVIVFEIHEYITHIPHKVLLDKLNADYDCNIYEIEGHPIVKCFKKANN